MSMQTERIPEDEARTGVTEEEAKEIHSLFMRSFLIFTAVAVFAHLLAWIWRPWLPSASGYSALTDGITAVLPHIG